MTNEQYLKNLKVPTGQIDIVLDTDAYNEIDDQFAIAYMLKYKNKLNVKGIYAAPFYNSRSSGPEDGMLKSYDEVVRLLKLADENELCKRVLHGSRGYLKDEKTPVISPAVNDLVLRHLTVPKIRFMSWQSVLLQTLRPHCCLILKLLIISLLYGLAVTHGTGMIQRSLI